MVEHACYRPHVPSDLSAEQLQDQELLEREGAEYAASFVAEEDTCRFDIGCSDFDSNRAFFWIIEAARLLAGCQSAAALKLLQMAAQEVRDQGAVE
jgi:hypothetical protein